MPTPRELHRAGTTLTSLVMVGLGVALIVTTIVHGGGALAVGLFLGILFIAAGAGRLWMTLRRG